MISNETFKNLKVAAQYQPQQLLCFFVEAPKYFDDLISPIDFNISQCMKDCAEEIFNNHVTSLSGFTGTLNVDATIGVYEDNTYGVNINNVVLENTIPVIGFKEVAGEPIRNFLSDWIIGSNAVVDKKQVGMTLLFIEPDSTGTKATRWWLCSHLFPLSNGPVYGEKVNTFTPPKVKSQFEITFRCVTRHGLGETELTKQYLK